MPAQIVFLWGLTQALPTDVLDQLPILRSVTGPIVSSIPSAASFVARTSFPQVAEVILCLGWVLALPNLLFGLLLPEHLQKTRPRRLFGDLADIKPAETGFGAFLFAGMFFLALIPALLWIFLAVPIFDPMHGVGNDYALFAYTQRLTFGFVAQAVSSLCGIFGALWALTAGHVLGFFIFFFRR